MKESTCNHPAGIRRFSIRLGAVLGFLGPFLAPGQDESINDFSHTNSVSVVMTRTGRRREIGDHGLQHPARAGGDAQTTFTEAAGVPCGCLDSVVERYPKAYLPFRLDPSFKSQGVSNVRIEVEYFDGLEGQEGVFGLQYDAMGAGNGPNQANKACLPNVPLRGSQKWLKATFHVKNATFHNSQNAGGDFRLWASPPELCVSRVTVTLEAPEQAPKEIPLTFNAAGEAKLGEWNVQWDSGAKPLFASSRGNTNETHWVEVRAPGTFGVGSWRTTVLLEPGEYQFVGKARTDGLEGGSQACGVSLRMSYQRQAKVVSQAPDWTTLTYDVKLPALTYVELICEVRGSQGSARFDLDSLKLIRKARERL